MGSRSQGMDKRLKFQRSLRGHMLEAAINTCLNGPACRLPTGRRSFRNRSGSCDCPHSDITCRRQGKNNAQVLGDRLGKCAQAANACPADIGLRPQALAAATTTAGTAVAPLLMLLVLAPHNQTLKCCERSRKAGEVLPTGEHAVHAKVGTPDENFQSANFGEYCSSKTTATKGLALFRQTGTCCTSIPAMYRIATSIYSTVAVAR